MQDQTQVDGMTRTLYGSGLIKAAAKAAYHATKSKSVLTKDATSTNKRILVRWYRIRINK